MKPHEFFGHTGGADSPAGCHSQQAEAAPAEARGWRPSLRAALLLGGLGALPHDPQQCLAAPQRRSGSQAPRTPPPAAPPGPPRRDAAPWQAEAGALDAALASWSVPPAGQRVLRRMVELLVHVTAP